MNSSPATTFIRPDELWRSLGLQAGQRVVHLGCGAGFYLIPAAKIVGKSGSVVGVDILAHLLEEAEGRARRENVAEVIKTVRANLEIANGSTLPSANADWVLVANILHQSDADKILSEARRIVKDLGSIVVIEWDTAATPFGPPQANRVSKAAVQSIAANLGLREKVSFSPSPYHYGLVLTPATK